MFLSTISAPLTPSLQHWTKARFYLKKKKNLSVYETNIIVQW